ncbi:LRR receptor-like serine threonine-protein kinase [Seminavis robusta]|uniref:LRR receptor-like serine threonine-protein kinase n=1 Tax=Seminavis robusta TaxID=568900 RepID=A0A9N8DBW8_9STRA|nr:LRR receptor-like serine threonine-protein kinase [Seminavis robusta]|eukprot:Sro74_g040600.1 LRR receptor-like serine threonine-protein kinase (1294) ;mRNA; f:2712-6593
MSDSGGDKHHDNDAIGSSSRQQSSPMPTRSGPAVTVGAESCRSDAHVSTDTARLQKEREKMKPCTIRTNRETEQSMPTDPAPLAEPRSFAAAGQRKQGMTRGRSQSPKRSTRENSRMKLSQRGNLGERPSLIRTASEPRALAANGTVSQVEEPDIATATKCLNRGQTSATTLGNNCDKATTSTDNLETTRENARAKSPKRNQSNFPLNGFRKAKSIDTISSSPSPRTRGPTLMRSHSPKSQRRGLRRDRSVHSPVIVASSSWKQTDDKRARMSPRPNRSPTSRRGLRHSRSLDGSPFSRSRSPLNHRSATIGTKLPGAVASQDKQQQKKTKRGVSTGEIQEDVVPNSEPSTGLINSREVLPGATSVGDVSPQPQQSSSKQASRSPVSAKSQQRGLSKGSKKQSARNHGRSTDGEEKAADTFEDEAEVCPEIGEEIEDYLEVRDESEASLEDQSTGLDSNTSGHDSSISDHDREREPLLTAQVEPQQRDSKSSELQPLTPEGVLVEATLVEEPPHDEESQHAAVVVQAHAASLADLLQNKRMQCFILGLVLLTSIMFISMYLILSSQLQSNNPVPTPPSPPTSDDSTPIATQPPSPAMHTGNIFDNTNNTPKPSAPTASPTSAAATEGPTLPDTLLLTFSDDSLPQAKAFNWLNNHPDKDFLPKWQYYELFALATFYYSFGNGEEWPDAYKQSASNFLNYSVPACDWGDLQCHANESIKVLKYAGPTEVNRQGSERLTGTVPTEISFLSNLETLDLRFPGVEIEGMLPTTLATLPNLWELRIEDFTGDLPSTVLGSMQQLRTLDLKSDPPFTITTELLQLPYLIHLQLTSLKGTIPTELGLMTSLTSCELIWGLEGFLPTELGQLSLLEKLALYGNRLTGSLPSEFGELTAVTHFDVSDSKLTGSIPEAFWRVTNMVVLDLSGNMLTSSIPADAWKLTNIKDLRLNHNYLNGTISSEISNLAEMHTLALNSNQLSGFIPSELGLVPIVHDLSLQFNQLSGVLPTELGLLGHIFRGPDAGIETLDISYNSISGPIPSELGVLKFAQKLDLSQNQITGTIPTELGLLYALGGSLYSFDGLGLYLGGNQITGSVPSSLCALTVSFGVYLEIDCDMGCPDDCTCNCFVQLIAVTPGPSNEQTLVGDQLEGSTSDGSNQTIPDKDTLLEAIDEWISNRTSPYGPIGDWDVSRINNFDFLFAGREDFNDNINGWVTSQTTSLVSTFEGAQSFDQPLDSWDVSTVEDFRRAFRAAFAFNHPLAAWDVSSATSMQEMFQLAKGFNQDISMWNVSTVQSFNSM